MTRSVVWALTLLAAVGFVAVAWAVSAGLTAGTDRDLMLSLRSAADPEDPLGPLWLEAALAEITALGGYTILVILSAIVLGSLLLLGEGRAAAFLFASLVSGSLVSSGLKLLFARPRPDLVGHLDQTFTSSFPSAHAMVSTVAYMTLAAVAVRFLPMRRERVYVVVVAALLAFAIGASRVYLGVHWPSDVLAGWLAGGAWAGLCWLAADAWTRSFAMPGRIGRTYAVRP